MLEYDKFGNVCGVTKRMYHRSYGVQTPPMDFGYFLRFNNIILDYDRHFLMDLRVYNLTTFDQVKEAFKLGRTWKKYYSAKGTQNERFLEIRVKAIDKIKTLVLGNITIHWC